MIFIALLAAGGFVIRKKAKPSYESHAVVYISPKFPKMLAGDSEVELPYDSYVQDQIATVTRFDIIGDAIEKLPESVRHRTGPALPFEIFLLQKNLEVKRVGATYEVSISLHGPKAAGLADTVNAVTDSYVERAKNEEFYGRDERLTTLHQEKERLRKEMDDKLSEQAQLMQQLGVATLASAEGAANPYDSTSSKLRDQFNNAQIARQAAEVQLTSVLKQNGNGGTTVQDPAIDEAIAADQALSSTRASLNSRRNTLVEEMTGLRPEHPVYQKDKEELDSIDSQLAELRRKAADKLQEKLRLEVNRSRMVELQLERELGEKTHTASSAAPKLQRASELGPEIDSLQKAYSAVDDRIREIELESSSPGSMHVSTRAMDPLGPEPSKLHMYIGALLVASLLLATGVPIGLDFLDSHIYTASDVERVVGFHPIGVLLDTYEVRKEIANEYDFRLAAGIDHAVRNTGARTFLFTSPAHGNGTTSVVEKVGEKLTHLGLRTLTISASRGDELIVPSGNVPLQKYLPSQIQGRMDEIQVTGGLSPVTPYFENPRFRSSQEASTRNPVLESLRQSSQQYDVVLIDASPLPLSANTEYLARVSDATVLVVKSSTTTRKELNRSARLLERLEVAGVAVVLNQVSIGRADRALRSELEMYEERYRDRRNPVAQS